MKLWMERFECPYHDLRDFCVFFLSMGVWGICKRSRHLKILARLQRRLTASDFKNVLEKREREREKMRKGWWRREARKPLTVQRHRCRGLQRKLCPDMKIHNPNSNERERERQGENKRESLSSSLHCLFWQECEASREEKLSCQIIVWTKQNIQKEDSTTLV